MKEYDYGTISEDWEMTLSDYDYFHDLEPSFGAQLFDSLMTIGFIVFCVIALCSAGSRKEQG